MKKANADEAPAEEQAAMPGAKVSRAEMISVLKFGVAGALTAQQDGESGVTLEHVDAVVEEIGVAVSAGLPAVTAGIRGRKPSNFDSAANAATVATAATLGDSEEAASSSARGGGEVDLQEAVEALGRGSRERASRFMQVGGDLVLKINNYTLQEGERSVFDSELEGRQDRPGERRRARSQAGKDYQNFSHCQLCWKQGDLLCCDYCPTVMHPHCAGVEDIDSLGNTWACPHHKCSLCGRKAYAAGGLLFRCTECPKAFCEDHLPLEAELLGGEVDRLVKLGFKAVKQACYVYCGGDCKALREARDEDEELLAELVGEEGEEGEEDEEGEEGEEGEEDGEEDEEEMEEDEEEMEEAEGSSAMPEAPPKVVSRMAVEISGSKGGDKGSWYGATVVSVSGEKATLRHDELQDEQGGLLKETVSLKLLRPAPPQPAAGWLESVKEGAALELQYLGGWWEVKLLKWLPPKGEKPPRFKVVAERYNAQHTVEAAALRPGWKWVAGRNRWQTRA